MDRMEFTIFFENPFWVGICIRYGEDSILSARHVFGPEPSNGEIIHFYLNYFDSMKFIEYTTDKYQSNGKNLSYKKSLQKGKREQLEKGGRSMEIFNNALSASLAGRRINTGKEKGRRLEEKFRNKQIKKKEKRRGH